METKLTFDEEMAVATALQLRIRDLSNTLENAQACGYDSSVLRDVLDNLLVAYRKLTGIEFKLV